jgi:DNA repair ATPase RecN
MGTTQSIFSIPNIFYSLDELYAHLETIVADYEAFGNSLQSTPTIYQTIKNSQHQSDFKELYQYIVSKNATNHTLETLLTRFKKVELRIETLRYPSSYACNNLSEPLLLTK